MPINNYKHGMTHTKLHYVWLSLKQRCFNQNNPGYKNYGGRGIKVCDEWLNDFKAFYDWAMGNGYRSGLAIDRIDNNGNYGPSNCRFVTQAQNNKNKKNNKLNWVKITEIRKLKNANPTSKEREIAEIYNVSQPTINKILKNKIWVE